jgi:pyruvate kinase
MIKRTKIVATMGPACQDKAVLKAMILQGVDVCRLNLSHGAHVEHLACIKLIEEIRKETGLPIGILADLQGPKLRIGNIENGAIEIKKDDILTFTTKEQIGNAEKVYMTYQAFPKDVKVGEKVLVDDGKLVLEVIATDKVCEVQTKVLHGGLLKSKKGVNLPNTKISLNCLTEKDLIDLTFALENKVDWIGLSFVRSARDIIELKHIISESRSTARVVAKIEKPEAIEDIDFIIRETDAVMVARGDLGVEIPMEKVPRLQKIIVEKCRQNAKPVIIATQMMESMIENISPTRAEVNDVANAVLDGADAVMLSGETSVGAHPIKVIESMAKIIQEVESDPKIYHHETAPVYVTDERFMSDSICFSAVRIAQRTEAKCMSTMTFSGYSALKLSSQRPKALVFAFTSNAELLTKLSLAWGVYGFFYDKMVSTDHTLEDVQYLLKKNGFVKQGDFIVNTASMPIATKGKTNMIKLTQVS